MLTIVIETRASFDPYRPQYHFSAPKNWLNDPNGLIQWRGEYHLFYQHNPHRPHWGPMHWGHAVSTDLLHWRHLPIALAPDVTGDDGDTSGIFSGSAVDDDGVLTLIYTLHTDPRVHPGATPEVQCIATSRDGITFAKYPGNPVIGELPSNAEAGFRDPKVWRTADGGWNLVVGSGHAGRGRVFLYASDDLRRWDCRGVLHEGDGTTGGMWECPDFFRLGDKHVLIVSVNHLGRQYTQYFVGTFDGHRLRVEREGPVDFGPDFYAAQTLLDHRGRRVMIGWMDHWGAEPPTRFHGWAGAMSIPRELFLTPDGRLGMRPVDELKRLRSSGRPRVRWDDLRVSTGGPILEAHGELLEIAATFTIDDTDAEEFGLGVRCSPDGTEETLIGYQPSTHTLYLDGSRSGLSKGAVFKTTLGALQGQLSLRVLIDRSSVEVFTDDGAAAGTMRIYPSRPTSLAVRPFVRGGSAKLTECNIWPLQLV